VGYDVNEDDLKLAEKRIRERKTLDGRAILDEIMCHVSTENPVSPLPLTQTIQRTGSTWDIGKCQIMPC
jgi:hypothetical protein